MCVSSGAGGLRSGPVLLRLCVSIQCVIGPAVPQRAQGKEFSINLEEWSVKETREPALVIAFTTANDITAQSVELAAAVQGHVSKAHTGQLNKNGSACKTSRALAPRHAHASSRAPSSASAWTEGTQIFGAAFGTTWVVIGQAKARRCTTRLPFLTLWCSARRRLRRQAAVASCGPACS